MTSLEEYAQKINQEIKDKKLGYKDPEYYRLKMKITTQKNMVKCECPECGKIISLKTYKFYHKCKGKREDIIRFPQTEILKLKVEKPSDETDLKLNESIDGIV